MDPDYIFVIDFNSCLNELGYLGADVLWYRLGGESHGRSFRL